MTDGGDQRFRDQIAALLAGLPKGCRPALLVFPFDVAPQVVYELLENADVAACMVTPDCHAAHVPDTRIGVFGGRSVWSYPICRARTLVFVGQPSRLRPRRLLDARTLGIKTVVTMNAFGDWNLSTLHGWILRQLVSQWRGSVIGNGWFRWPTTRKLWDDWLARRSHGALTAILCKASQKSASDFGRQLSEDEKILLVGDSLGPGGAERQLVYTALGMAEAGCKVSVACVNAGSPDFDFHRPALQGRVPLRQTGDLADLLLTGQDRDRRQVSDLLADRNVRRLLRGFPPRTIDEVVSMTALFVQERPAVVHLWQDYTNLVGGLAALLAGVPTVVLGSRSLAPHHAIYHRPYMRSLYRLLLAQPNVKLLNNSAAGARSYEQWLGVPSGRIRVIHNAMPDLLAAVSAADRRAWRARFDIPPHAPVVGGVFRFSEEKDPLLWLSAAEAVARIRPETHFLLVGDGPMREQLRRQVIRLGLAEHVHMPGQQQDVAVALAVMDVLLLASRVEGLPNVLIEAQAMGCPVVTTDVGGSGETFEHGVTGWLVAERSASALADRLLAVLSDSQWRNTARDRGPQLILERFGKTRMVHETLTAYGDGV